MTPRLWSVNRPPGEPIHPLENILQPGATRVLPQGRIFGQVGVSMLIICLHRLISDKRTVEGEVWFVVSRWEDWPPPNYHMAKTKIGHFARNSEFDPKNYYFQKNLFLADLSYFWNFHPKIIFNRSIAQYSRERCHPFYLLNRKIYFLKWTERHWRDFLGFLISFSCWLTIEVAWPGRKMFR